MTIYVLQTVFVFIYRSAVKAVLEKVTTSAFHYTARGLVERDRFIFALLLAIEVRDIYICIYLHPIQAIDVSVIFVLLLTSYIASTSYRDER